jgi:hypothetical protein
MAQQITQQPKEIELLKQLIGEWSVGIAIKTSDGRVISGCGEMTAVEIQDSMIDSEVDTHIEDYFDFYENDLWSFDQPTGKTHLFSVTSEGDFHDHVGNWKDPQTLELTWRGTCENQDLQEQITVRWLTKDQFELKAVRYQKSEALLITNYIFKRKKNPKH